MSPVFRSYLRLKRRLKRWVAPGLRSFAGGSQVRPDAGERPKNLSAETRRQVVGLAWPIAVTMLGDTAMGLVDTKLVSGLGAAALGGVGIATMIMWLNYAIVFGVMRGVKVRTAHAVGEGRADVSLAYVKAGLCVAFLAGVFVFLLGRDATWAFVRLGVDPATIPYAREFLAARTWGALSICMLSALVQYRQGRGDARSPMIVGLLGNVLNAGLAYSLIYGRFGFPALGVRGAGYGTAIAETVEVLILLALVGREALAASAKKSAVARISSRKALAEVCEIGLPTGLQFGAEMLAFTTFTAILGGLGANEIAGHQVAMAILRTSFLPGIAVSEAASVLVGKALGARRLSEADRVTRTAIALAAGFMTLCGLFFAFGGGVIARQFATEPGLFAVVRKLLLVAAIFQTLDAVTIVLRGALRGAKDVRAVMIIGITVVWCCVPGAAYVFGRVLGLGAMGGWLGFIGETSVSAGLFWWRWTRGAWRLDYEQRSESADTSLSEVHAA
jgi:MATE family multidrug resistance protein